MRSQAPKPADFITSFTYIQQYIIQFIHVYFCCHSVFCSPCIFCWIEAITSILFLNTFQWKSVKEVLLEIIFTIMHAFHSQSQSRIPFTHKVMEKVRKTFFLSSAVLIKSSLSYFSCIYIWEVILIRTLSFRINYSHFVLTIFVFFFIFSALIYILGQWSKIYFTILERNKDSWK